MAYQELCAVCNHANREEIEARCNAVKRGQDTWRNVARAFGRNVPSLQSHMKKHYEAPTENAKLVGELVDDFVTETVVELREQARFAPTDLKALYAILIHNLSGLKQTKPDQKTLVAALKAVYEVTGMKQDQRIKLEMAQQAFGKVTPAAALLELEAEYDSADEESDEQS